ncbi:hypothetical protein KSP40_PGU014035 [Platanthera guangdongensis]|uniref:Serine aminopeptidase S33 domain-containing protein n=1 Tax=Platanthera guangdongensis TaxID=2320717 RepID=A0ABR2MBE6_9ASPA
MWLFQRCVVVGRSFSRRISIGAKAAGGGVWELPRAGEGCAGSKEEVSRVVNAEGASRSFPLESEIDGYTLSVCPYPASYELNSRGIKIFTKSWLLENSPIKALVFICHGYGDTCTFFIEGIAKKIASSGYGVFAMDYPGFGLSDGLHGFIPSFNDLVNDVIEHFSKCKSTFCTKFFLLLNYLCM